MSDAACLTHPQGRQVILAAQGLTAVRGGASLVETLEQTGWVRTLSGVAAFLRDEVGHGRSFSLDTEKDLRRRCAQIRGMG